MPENPGPKIPLLDPETDTCLFRSLRYDLETGMLRDHDADLYAKECDDGTVIFWFRHWTWNRNETAICQITSRDEAARFIREQFTKPGLFTGWNHVGLARFLPEVYGKG
nr:hypothetical protein [uncultured Methanoregula sp.]